MTLFYSHVIFLFWDRVYSMRIFYDPYQKNHIIYRIFFLYFLHNLHFSCNNQHFPVTFLSSLSIFCNKKYHTFPVQYSSSVLSLFRFLSRPPLHPFHIRVFCLFPVTSADIHNFPILQQHFLLRTFLHIRKINQKACMAAYKIIAGNSFFYL